MILLTGGAGGMGKRLARRLLDAGRPVRVLALPGDAIADALPAQGIDVVRGDVTRPATLGTALHGVSTVYHLAGVILAPGRPEVFQAVNVEGTRNVVDAARRAGVGAFIHVSSASVAYARQNPYSRSKAEGERIVLASGLPATVVRPTLAYGDPGAREFALFVRLLRAFPVVPLIGSGESRKAPVHVDDLADGFAALADRTDTAGRIYNFAGAEVLTLLAMSRAILAVLGTPKPVVRIPVAPLRVVAGLAERLLPPLGIAPPLTWQSITGFVEDADLDISMSRRDLGWNPRSFLAALPDALRMAV